MGGELFNGIKSMYVNSQACVRVKGGESECFRIDSGVRQGCIMSPWLFNVYMETVTKEEGREWRLPGFLQADDLILCGELDEEDLRAMVRRFIEMCRRRSLKVNAGKSKMVVLSGEEGLECKVCGKVKYLG